jgi:hypothetical protein
MNLNDDYIADVLGAGRAARVYRIKRDEIGVYFYFVLPLACPHLGGKAVKEDVTKLLCMIIDNMANGIGAKALKI